jgi:hypothetical protein
MDRGIERVARLNVVGFVGVERAEGLLREATAKDGHVALQGQGSLKQDGL